MMKNCICGLEPSLESNSRPEPLVQSDEIKYRVHCRACGYKTAWHEQPSTAKTDWNLKGWVVHA